MGTGAGEAVERERLDVTAQEARHGGSIDRSPE